MKVEIHIILSLFLLFFLVFPLHLWAAEVYFAPAGHQLDAGDILRLEIRIRSKDTINAFSIAAFYPPEKLKLLEINEKKSLINLWVKKPSALSDKGKIFFTGGKIGGFNGDGLLAEATFQIKKPGKAYLIFSPESLVLRHDGFGTPEPTNFLASEFNLK